MTTIDTALLHDLLHGRRAAPDQRPPLEAAGCRFDDDGLLLETGLGVWGDYLQAQLSPGRHVAVYRRTASTQDVARGLVEQLGCAADGAAILADEQSSGRGRLGRSWVAPAGSALLMSRACAGSAVRADRLFMVAAVAVACAVEQVTTPPLAARIKWPNDILVDGRKLAGILVESFNPPRGEPAAIIGIGVNVAAAPSLPGAGAEVTSLRDCGREVDRLLLAGAILAQLDMAMQYDHRRLLEQWRSRSTLLACQVQLVCDGQHITGEVIDLDPTGDLIVRQNDGTLMHLPARTTTFVQ